MAENHPTHRDPKTLTPADLPYVPRSFKTSREMRLLADTLEGFGRDKKFRKQAANVAMHCVQAANAIRSTAREIEYLRDMIRGRLDGEVFVIEG